MLGWVRCPPPELGMESAPARKSQETVMKKVNGMLADEATGIHFRL